MPLRLDLDRMDDGSCFSVHTPISSRLVTRFPIWCRTADEVSFCAGFRPGNTSIPLSGVNRANAAVSGIAISTTSSPRWRIVVLSSATSFRQRVPRLFAALALARGDGRYARVLKQLARVDLLILDDWGPEPLIAEQQRDLLEIVEDRYNAGSLIITSQVPVDRWHGIVGNPTLADAILDRFIHNAHRIELKGESLRKQRARA